MLYHVFFCRMKFFFGTTAVNARENSKLHGVATCEAVNTSCLKKTLSIFFGSLKVFKSRKGFHSLVSIVTSYDGFKSMIRFCTCPGGSSSPPINRKQQGGLKPCKSCGGKILVDGRGSLSGRMLSTAGLELSKVINPDLNWKKTAKGRQRAVRRARRTFTAGNKNNFAFGGLNKREDLTDKESNRTGDMAVSESEKLGVTLLEGRFSSNPESVPIKKRRFLLARSPSPAHRSSSQSGDSANISGRQPSLSEQDTSDGKYHALNKSGVRIKSFGDGSSKDDLNGKLCDTADFSGISILAAAACDSKLGSDFMDEEEGERIKTIKDLNGKTDAPRVVSTSLLSPGKVSDGYKLDGSCNLENFDCSLQNVSDKTSTVQPATRGDRLHWDLNTVMDVWESSTDEVLDRVVREENHALEVSEAEEKHTVSGVDFLSDHNLPCLLPGDDLVPNEPELLRHDALIARVEVPEGTKSPCHQEKCSLTDEVVSSTVKAGSEVSCSAKSLAVVDQIASEANTAEVSAAAFDDQSARSCPSDVDMVQATSSIRPQAEKQALQSDLGNGKTKLCSMSSNLAENSSVMMVDGDASRDMFVDTNGKFGECAFVNGSSETESSSMDKLKEASTSVFPSDSHVSNSQQLPKQDGLNSVAVCDRGYEAMDLDMNMQDRCSVTTDEILTTAEADSLVHIDNKASICNPAGTEAVVLDKPSVDNAPNSNQTLKSDIDATAASVPQVVLKDNSDCDYYSDASQSDNDQSTGMEKVEFLGDEDYQYEDGEFREPFLNCWAEDGADEGETEHVDYGSDNRETDIFEAASDLPASVRLHDGLSDENEDNKYDTLSGMEKEAVLSQPVIKSSSVTGLDVDRKLERDTNNALESVTDGHARGKRDCFNGGERSSDFMKLSRWDRLREGHRGPGDGVVDFGVANQNQTNTSLNTPNARTSSGRVGSSLRRGSSSRMERPKSSDVSHRKDKTYVNPRRSNEHNDLDSRVAPRSIGRDGSSLRTHGRDRRDRLADSRNHVGSNHGDSRDYYDSSSLSNPATRDAAAAAVAKLESSGFIVSSDGTILKAGSVGPAGRLLRRPADTSSHGAYRPPEKRRLSIERNGTFGAPSGLESSREMNHDRHTDNSRDIAIAGRYVSAMVNTNHKDGYRRPMLDESRVAPLCLHSSRREQSFSPRRRPPHPHTRSTSRSRTRSPHAFTSPRGRNDRMNGVPGLQPRSGSPNFKHEVSMQRPRSPHRRTDLVDHMVDYGLSSRDHGSTHSSRWVDERKGLPDHFREHEKNRLPRRSPPRREFSRGQIIKTMDSIGRTKPNESYRPIPSRNYTDFVDFGRGSRFDEPGNDRKGYANSQELLHSARQRDPDGNMKRFPYDAQNGFRAHDTRPRSSEFQQRGSPRAMNEPFRANMETQLGELKKRKLM